MRKTLSILLPTVLLVIVAGAVWFMSWRSDSVELEFFVGDMNLGTIQTTVVATGSLEPLSKVQVGSQVSGKIQDLYADFNTVVVQGQLLAKIDPRQLETQVQNAQANLAAARSRIRTSEADLENAIANVGSSDASLTTAEAELARAETNYVRALELFEAGLEPMTQLEDAGVNLQSAEARLISAGAALQQSEAQIISQEAGLEQAESAVIQAGVALEEAQVNLGYTDIRSPVNGVVISREVDRGQTVSASTSAPTLFQIAEDLSRMHVVASVDEADIGLLKPNAEVEFMVDAYPSDRFNGQIQQIRLNPQTSQNVVTYQVIVGVLNPERKLKPGMTASLTVTLERRDGVLTVPNVALRYSPPEDYLATLTVTTPRVVFDSSNLLEGSESFAHASFGGDGGGAATRVVRTPGHVWVLNLNSVPEQRTLMLGLTDGTRSEVASGDIRQGEAVIIGDSSEIEQESTGNSGNPSQMFRMISRSLGR